MAQTTEVVTLAHLRRHTLLLETCTTARQVVGCWQLADRVAGVRGLGGSGERHGCGRTLRLEKRLAHSRAEGDSGLHRALKRCNRPKADPCRRHRGISSRITPPLNFSMPPHNIIPLHLTTIPHRIYIPSNVLSLPPSPIIIIISSTSPILHLIHNLLHPVNIKTITTVELDRRDGLVDTLLDINGVVFLVLDYL